VPWGEKSVMSLRREFVVLAGQAGANMRSLCRRYGISPTIGYRWLARYRAEGEAGLVDRSRRPRHSPERTPAAVEAQVLAVRDANPAWGGRKLRRRLQDLGATEVPSASTMSAILERHGRLAGTAAERARDWQRFERAAPNELWQMDFKGHFAMAGGRCHPLTVLDDHSRFSLTIAACADEREMTVRQRLQSLFRRYGLPDALLMDNGSPWGGADSAQPYTALTVWFLQLGIQPLHGRPHHPQTQGKDERFHRSLKAEAIGNRAFRDLAQCQQAFDDWRAIYNLERPHEALGLATPASRYQPSRRAFPESLPRFDYGPGALLRRVQQNGEISFKNHVWRIGSAFTGHTVVLRPTCHDGRFDVVFCGQAIAQLDLGDPP
jgi:transposase InsO family protein